MVALAKFVACYQYQRTICPPWCTFGLMDSLVPNGCKIVNNKQCIGGCWFTLALFGLFLVPFIQGRMEGWPFLPDFGPPLSNAEWRGSLFCLLWGPLCKAEMERSGWGQHLLSTRIYSAKVHRTITEIHITGLQIYMNITPSKASLHYL
jgi:hypothetical protein